MKCERCGSNFQYKSQLKRHLQLKTECPITYSIATRSYLIDQLKDEPIVTSYVCTCGKNYKHVTNLYRHRAKCDKYSKLSNNDLRKELNALKKTIADMRNERDAALTPTTIGRDQNITNNNNTRITNNTNNMTINVPPWNPTTLDYSIIGEREYEQAFGRKYQVATLARSMIKSSKSNHVMIIADDGTPLFYNGSSFVNVPNGINQTHAVLFEAIKDYSEKNENQLRLIYNEDEEDIGFYDDHKSRLIDAENSKSSHDKLIEVIKKQSSDVKKTHAIEA